MFGSQIYEHNLLRRYECYSYDDCCFQVGKNVTKFKVGDKIGVGCMVDSCRECSSCKEGCEEYCEEGHTGNIGFFYV